jgi:hypothetical protein
MRRYIGLEVLAKSQLSQTTTVDLRRGHNELTVDVPAHDRVLVAFTALAPFL